MSKTMWRISVMKSLSMRALLFRRAGYRSLDCLFHDSGQGLPGNLVGVRPEMPGRRITFDVGVKDFELEREMSEDMRDRAGAPPVAGKGRSRVRGGAVHPRRPAGCRHLGHAAEQTFFGPLAQKDGAVRTHRDESSAAPLRLVGFGQPHREIFRIA